MLNFISKTILEIQAEFLAGCICFGNGASREAEQDSPDVSGSAAGTAKVCGKGVALAFISCCPCFSLDPQHLWRAQDCPAAQESGRNGIPPGLWLCGFCHQAGCQGELCPSLPSWHCPSWGGEPGGSVPLRLSPGLGQAGSIPQESCPQAETPMWAAQKPTTKALMGIISVQLIK